MSASAVLGLRLWEVDVRLEADDAGFLPWFGRFYARFLIPPTSLRPNALTYTLRRAGADDPRAWLTMPEQTALIADLPLAQGFLYDRILHDILAHVRSHLLFHAGAASAAGQGLLLAADAMHGKTTLTLALALRGAGFLSDELGALGRADGRLYPFPRALRLRPGTLTRLGLGALEAAEPAGMGSQLLNIEAIRRGGCVEVPLPLRQVFCLTEAAPVAPTPTPLSLRVSCLKRAWLADVAALDGVRGVEVDDSTPLPQVRLTATRRATALAQIERLCVTHGVLWLDVVKREAPLPTFDKKPEIRPIPPSQAAMLLLTHFQAGQQSHLLQHDMRNQATRLLAETTRLLSPARCFTLSVGPLPDMVDLILAQVPATPQTPAMLQE